jgi:HK97 family phage portal protein
MGFLDFLKKNRKPANTKIAPVMNGIWPMYTQYGADLYSSDVVQQAIACIAAEIKKLRPTHVRYRGEDPVPVRGSIQDVLSDPNAIMTTSEFLEKTTWLLLLNANAFILPVYRSWIDEESGEERRYYESLFPLQPLQVNFIEDAGDRLFVDMYFPNGFNVTVPYEHIIHIRYNYSVNMYMGGGIDGNLDNAAIKDACDLNAKLLSSVAKAMSASYSINGVIKYNTLLDDDKITPAIRELERRLAANESGFLPLDLKGDFIPIKRETKIVDTDVLKFVDSKVLRNWAVPLPILSGDYTKDQYEAFYQRALEPIIISIAQAFTKKLFTPRQKAFGNRIELYPKDLIFMSQSQTLQMIEILSPTGALYENEKRSFLGLRPLKELEGVRLMSLNWIDANNAQQYQLGLEKAKPEVVDVEETKEEV